VSVSGRKGLTAAVLVVAVGAGLVLWGASQVWWIQTVPQPAPLRPQDIAHTGGSLAPALPALGLVALAGAGGLLATRGIGRRLVGGLLLAVALGVVVLVVGALGPVGLGWPLACLGGALLAGAGGALAVKDGGRWPVMGSRYGRGTPAAAPDPAEKPVMKPSAGRDTSAELWDALERGEDPTRR